MLHVRYDWRRPVFWSTLCLSLFFSSQTKVVENNGISVNELVKTINKMKPADKQQAGERAYYNNFSAYLFVAK